jgi:hypothetical protein
MPDDDKAITSKLDKAPGEPSDESCARVDGAPLKCAKCQAPLCLRKQVVNLALGNTDEMFCLNCIALDNEQEPLHLLQRMMRYISQRDCFRKEWQRYTTVASCPDQANCFPSNCFVAFNEVKTDS